MRRFFMLLLRLDITFVDAEYVRSEDNVVPDLESRRTDQGDWRCTLQLLRRAFEVLGTPSIDLFASSGNRVVKRFASWRANPGSTFVDAFTVDWSGEFAWIVAPFNLLARIFQALTQMRARAVVLVPVWPAQSWWPVYLRCCEKEMIVNPEDFVPGDSGNVEPRRGAWGLRLAVVDGSMMDCGV
jgi:hypothetical protein